MSFSRYLPKVTFSRFDICRRHLSRVTFARKTFSRIKIFVDKCDNFRCLPIKSQTGQKFSGKMSFGQIFPGHSGKMSLRENISQPSNLPSKDTYPNNTYLNRLLPGRHFSGKITSGQMSLRAFFFSAKVI
jgi:hypothetical protein